MPLVHILTQLYKLLYALGKKLQKRDRFGLHTHIEQTCMQCLEYSIQAAFLQKFKKAEILQNLQVHIEILKRFIRIAQELNIYTQKDYLIFENSLQEISKMTSGWKKYLTQKAP
ncbi:MAG: hypothetical protein UU76_C0012G0028 [Parcubacteria group bacterium GW2011_GWC1_41_7]|nr:MAG: hypothetical protein UU76_C0012G0028 [Parcubacteria group bacterium GW2011_GWC1_41_7]